MNIPFSSGMTVHIALVVPVDVGMTLWAGQWPSHHSFLEGLSTVFWVGSYDKDCIHEFLYVAKVFIDDFSQECQAISGVRSIADSLARAVMIFVVHGSCPLQTRGHQ